MNGPASHLEEYLMLRIHPAALTALLALALPALAAGQAAPDRHAGVAHDERIITRDTTKLHREIADRDSARSALAEDRHQTQAIEAQIDSLQHRLDRERAAKPRDAAAISRDEAALGQAKKTRDRYLSRDKHAAARLASVEQKVKQESDAAIDAHQDIKHERSMSTARRDSTRR
jgi:hypothetical protein